MRCINCRASEAAADHTHVTSTYRNTAVLVGKCWESAWINQPCSHPFRCAWTRPSSQRCHSDLLQWDKAILSGRHQGITMGTGGKSVGQTPASSDQRCTTRQAIDANGAATRWIGDTPKLHQARSTYFARKSSTYCKLGGYMYQPRHLHLQRTFNELCCESGKECKRGLGCKSLCVFRLFDLRAKWNTARETGYGESLLGVGWCWLQKYPPSR